MTFFPLNPFRTEQQQPLREKQSAPREPRLGPLHQAAQAVAIFHINRRRMIDAAYKNGDKYYHCKANAAAAQLGRVGELTAIGLSNMREGYDPIKNLILRKENDSDADQEANRYGRSRAKIFPKGDPGRLCLKYRPPALPLKYW